MNIWANTVLTDKGRALLAKLTQGNTLNITRAVTGAGFVTPGFLAKQTEVTDPKQTLEIRPASYPETGTCALTVALRNEVLTVGYEATQVGIYATDPDEGEILFFISQATAAGSGTTIPSETEMASYSAEWTFYFQYGQADSVNVTVDPAGAISREELKGYVDDALEPIKSDLNNKVTKESGKVLSSNDYTTEEKQKLAGIAAGANAYTHPDSHPASMITGLAPVATSGKYSDLVGTPDTMPPSAHDHTSNMRFVEGGLTKMPAEGRWSAVAYGNGKFVAVAYGGDIAAYSTDGVNWISSTLPYLFNFERVVYGGGKFLAVTRGDADSLYSTDGISWSVTTLPANLEWSSSAYGDGKFVVVATNGTDVAWSTDLESWNLSIMPDYSDWSSVAYGDGKFVAVATDSHLAAYSTDGDDWDRIILPDRRDWVSVAYGDGKFVAVATKSAYAAYSADGVNWIESTLPVSNNWVSVAYGGGKFVAVANGSNSDIAAYSADGVNWNLSTLPASEKWNSVTYGGGKFVAVAYRNAEGRNSDLAVYSTDGVHWATGVWQEGSDVGEDVRKTIGAAPAYSYGTEDLVAGVSELKTGTLYFVYE